MGQARLRRNEPVFEELDVVKTKATIALNGHVLPVGSVGAIVLVHRDGQAFEVEFNDPIPTVMTLEPNEIEHVRRAA